MEESTGIRWRWLKAMYIYTIVGAGGIGLAMFVVPRTFLSVLRVPAQDLTTFNLFASFLLGSGLAAIPALRSPLKFLPLLLLQIIYKTIWLAVVAIPSFLKGPTPLYVWVLSVIWMTYIIGDLIAIPFSYLFSRKQIA